MRLIIIRNVFLAIDCHSQLGSTGYEPGGPRGVNADLLLYHKPLLSVRELKG